jgi:hypothetical protein
MVSEDGPATETSSPGFNSNGGEFAVHPCMYLITTFLINCADKGESHTPAVKVILLGELLTTVETISNLLPDFRCKGEGWVLIRSTPVPVAFSVEDWEYTYWFPVPGINRKVKVMRMSIVNTGSITHCFV